MAFEAKSLGNNNNWYIPHKLTVVKIFKITRKLCKETKLKEFLFKFIHRIVVTKRELFKYGIKSDDECYFYGENDSIDHTFIHCSFAKSFIQKVIG